MFERGGLISLAALAAYIWIAPTTITGGDNAEFATLGTVGGVAHPSGYPLYLLWLRLLSWLPAASPAHATAIATSLLAGIHVLVLHAACRAWGARPLAATVAMAIYAASPIVLQIHTEAEVFALNSLIVSLVLWISATAGPLRGTWRVVILALVAGLGLSDHSTCILVAPVGLLGAARGIRESTRPRGVVIGLAVAALFAGLLPYVYLLVTPETPLSWTRITNVSGLLHHFLRRDYGGSGRLTSDSTVVDIGLQLRVLAGSILRAWLWLPAVLGIVALAVRCAKKPEEGRESRWGWATLAASIVLAGPLLVTRFNMDPHGVGLFVISRFHILPSLLLAIPVATSFDRLGSSLTRVRLRLALASALAVGGFLVLVARSLPHLARSQSSAVQLAIQNTLRIVPPRSVLIISPESLYFGAAYVQGVLRERPDVDVIGWPMMRSPEYRERLHAKTGLDVTAPAGGSLSVAIADQIMQQGRPLFIDAYGGSFARAFPTYPFGILYRVLPKGSAVPAPGELFEMNLALMPKLHVDYPLPTQQDYPAADIQLHYGRWWTTIADALAAAHDPREAQARELARQLSPSAL
jgi:hypothetical protein